MSTSEVERLAKPIASINVFRFLFRETQVCLMENLESLASSINGRQQQPCILQSALNDLPLHFRDRQERWANRCVT
jgi:hypothetical protein